MDVEKIAVSAVMHSIVNGVDIAAFDKEVQSYLLTYIKERDWRTYIKKYIEKNNLQF